MSQDAAEEDDEEMEEPDDSQRSRSSKVDINMNQVQIPKAFKVAPQKLVRTDAADRTLDSMFGYAATQKPTSTEPIAPDAKGKVIDLTLSGDEGESEKPVQALKSKQGPIKFSACKLTSVLQLRAQIAVDRHTRTSMSNLYEA